MHVREDLTACCFAGRSGIRGVLLNRGIGAWNYEYWYGHSQMLMAHWRWTTTTKTPAGWIKISPRAWAGLNLKGMFLVRESLCTTRDMDKRFNARETLAKNSPPLNSLILPICIPPPLWRFTEENDSCPNFGLLFVHSMFRWNHAPQLREPI